MTRSQRIFVVLSLASYLLATTAIHALHDHSLRLRGIAATTSCRATIGAFASRSMVHSADACDESARPRPAFLADQLRRFVLCVPFPGREDDAAGRRSPCRAVRDRLPVGGPAAGLGAHHSNRVLSLSRPARRLVAFGRFPRSRPHPGGACRSPLSGRFPDFPPLLRVNGPVGRERLRYVQALLNDPANLASPDRKRDRGFDVPSANFAADFPHENSQREGSERE